MVYLSILRGVISFWKTDQLFTVENNLVGNVFRSLKCSEVDTSITEFCFKHLMNYKEIKWLTKENWRLDQLLYTSQFCHACIYFNLREIR